MPFSQNNQTLAHQHQNQHQHPSLLQSQQNPNHIYSAANPVVAKSLPAASSPPAASSSLAASLPAASPALHHHSHSNSSSSSTGNSHYYQKNPPAIQMSRSSNDISRLLGGSAPKSPAHHMYGALPSLSMASGDSGPSAMHLESPPEGTKSPIPNASGPSHVTMRRTSQSPLAYSHSHSLTASEHVGSNSMYSKNKSNSRDNRACDNSDGNHNTSNNATTTTTTTTGEASDNKPGSHKSYSSNAENADSHESRIHAASQNHSRRASADSHRAHNRSSSSSSSSNKHNSGACASTGSGGAGCQDDASKAGYALWLPWEESALIDWLYEPTNRRLFNEPRRKKDCHERIIREVLPSKTSRAIEGKIRTLEKRYQRADSEIRRPDFASKHPSKRPEEVAEALCTNFRKLQAIFNPTQAARASQPPAAVPQQLPWISPAPLPSKQQALGGAEHVAFDQKLGLSIAAGVGLSVPRTTPPRLASAETMPPNTSAGIRKIAPKRGIAATEGSAELDTPPMFGPNNKRSRTFPTMPLVRTRSPSANRPTSDTRQPHAPQLPKLHSQAYELPLRPATAAVQVQCSAGLPTSNAVHSPMTVLSVPPTAPLPLQHVPRSSTGIPTILEPPPSATSATLPAPPSQAPAGAQVDPNPAVMGTREELDWLQLHLRREELAFRQQAFMHEKDIETRRIELEERRLAVQEKSQELEVRRIEAHERQMDVQLHTLKALTGLLHQSATYMSQVVGAVVGKRGDNAVQASLPPSMPPPM